MDSRLVVHYDFKLFGGGKCIVRGGTWVFFHHFMCLVSPFQFFGSSCSNRVLFYIFIFPERLTTTRPAQVTLPICCVGADTQPGSQSLIQSTAYEFSSSSAIPYTSSAYSHIQNSTICFLSVCFDKFSKGPCPRISGSSHPLIMSWISGDGHYRNNFHLMSTWTTSKNQFYTIKNIIKSAWL